jgi:uncharacterized protein YpbB
MMLLPISKDEKASHWECRCKCIPLSAHPRCFNNCRETFQDLYLLHKFEYDIKSKQSTILSAEWHGDSQIGSTKRIITLDMKKDVLSDLQSAIQDELGVTFTSWQEFFDTE